MNQRKMARRRRERALVGAIRGVQKDARQLRLSPECLARVEDQWAKIYGKDALDGKGTDAALPLSDD